MNKIATAEEVQTELKAVWAMTEESNPSRSKLATALTVLAERVAGTIEASFKIDRVRAGNGYLYDTVEEAVKAIEKIQGYRPGSTRVVDKRTSRHDTRHVIFVYPPESDSDSKNPHVIAPQAGGPIHNAGC